MSKRFLPSLDQVKRASESLPDPMSCEEDSYSVPVKLGSSERELVFSRVKFNSGRSSAVYRWIYEGKIMIRSGSERFSKSEESSENSFRINFALK
ncbi:MAG: hypothetical protein AAFX93_06915 [Verrucomicrobiota bacterium]